MSCRIVRKASITLLAGTSVRLVTLLAMYILIGTFVLIGHGNALGQGRKVGWPPETIPIGMWCSPPEPYITIDQYRKIAEAGFSVVLPPCEGKGTTAQNEKILRAARATGLKVILSDARLPLSLAAGRSATNAIRAVVSDYHKDPALLGYFLTDEPSADAFAGLGAVAAELHRLDPDHLVYINLFPNYASPAQLAAGSYDQYLDRFVSTVKPEVISYDHYPFLTTGDRPDYFANLNAVQRVASASPQQTPFWQIMLSVQHGSYRKMTENELRFQAIQSLVYGAQGLVYFTYWLPNDPSFQWSNAIMNRDGTEGPLYQPVKNVNLEVQHLAKWLYGARITGTYQTGEVAPDAQPLGNDVPVSVTGAGNLSVGIMRDLHGYLYVMVANRDYTKPVSATLLLDAGAHPIERLDVGTNRWQPYKEKQDADGKTPIKLELGPAGYALTRWF